VSGFIHERTDQQKQFDARTIQSLRDPLGTS